MQAMRSEAEAISSARSTPSGLSIISIIGSGLGAVEARGANPDLALDPGDGGAAVTLLNVSYDPTRELWRDLNEHFKSVGIHMSGSETIDDDSPVRPNVVS